METPHSFAAALQKWRTERDPPVSQSWLSKELGRSRTYVAQLESGSIAPPDLATCQAIEELLRVSPKGVVARTAARERLEKDDLLTWYLNDTLAFARTADAESMSRAEVALLQSAEQLEKKAPGATGVLAGAVDAALLELPQERRLLAYGNPARDFVRLMRAFRDGGPREVQAWLRIVCELLSAAEGAPYLATVAMSQLMTLLNRQHLLMWAQVRDAAEKALDALPEGLASKEREKIEAVLEIAKQWPDDEPPF